MPAVDDLGKRDITSLFVVSSFARPLVCIYDQARGHRAQSGAGGGGGGDDCSRHIGHIGRTWEPHQWAAASCGT